MVGTRIFVKSQRTGKFLFIQRDNKPTISSPNMWVPPGGQKELGETPEDSALRETEEEIGIKLSHVTLLTTYIFKKTIGKKTAHKKEYCFIAITDKTNVKLGEGQGYAWLTLDEYLAKQAPPELYRVVRKYRSELEHA